VSSARTRGGSSRGRLPGGYEVHLKGTVPGRGSSGCWAAIDRQIHGVLTCWGGGRITGSGGDRRGRSSRTFSECGSVVVTAVAATGGRGRTTGRDWLIVPAPGAGRILASVRRTSMVKRTNGARGVGGGASLMGVSVSPAVLTLGGHLCLGHFFFFLVFNFFFLFKSLLCLKVQKTHAALAMEIKNL